jgi:hypothetical protein
MAGLFLGVIELAASDFPRLDQGTSGVEFREFIAGKECLFQGCG